MHILVRTIDWKSGIRPEINELDRNIVLINYLHEVKKEILLKEFVSVIRYQVLAGIIEQRILEPMLRRNKLMLTAAYFTVRTANTYWGSLL